MAALVEGRASAAPRIPERDDAVIERLTLRATDPRSRELRELRARTSRAPQDQALALQLARRYFEIATLEGDPRYVGYADALIRPWLAAPSPEVRLVRALLRQYRHDFTGAFSDLDAVVADQPANSEARQWQFALHLVAADYAAARNSCDQLVAYTTRLATIVCPAIVDGLTGRAREAYATVRRALEQFPPQSDDYRQWVLTRLAEMAQRMGDRPLAERHYQEAIAAGPADGFILAAYADLLIEDGRHAEVMTLLRDWTASDVLLLRLAIAADSLRDPVAPKHRQTLRERFAASALRGDSLHQQEEARFALDLERDPRRALALASANWTRQREPRDALILLRAALAANSAASAKPGLDWMARSGYEEPRYRTLAAQLAGAAKPAARTNDKP